MRKISFIESVNEALFLSMRKSKYVVCFGLGINDPVRIFGSTKSLLENFGNSRVFETPTSENAMTGVGIGLSMNKYIPVMMHQRLDFILLAMDQIVNNAAKWRFMFGGKNSIPITIRLIIGKGGGRDQHIVRVSNQCLLIFLA